MGTESEVMKPNKIEREFNKLRKEDLIGVIVTGRLPENYQDNAILANYLDTRDCDRNDSKDVENALGSVNNINLYGRKNNANSEFKIHEDYIECLKNQIKILENTVNDKAAIIELLSEKIGQSIERAQIPTISETKKLNIAPDRVNLTPLNHAEFTKTCVKSADLDSESIKKNARSNARKPNIPAERIDAFHENKITNKHGAVTVKQLQAGLKCAQEELAKNMVQPNNKPSKRFQEDENGYTTVTYKKRNKQRPSEIGKNTDKLALDFVGPEKPKIWLFISKVKPHINQEDLTKYITNKLGGAAAEVELLETQKSKSNRRCFIVGVDVEHKDTVYESSFWPIGIKFSRFLFHLGGHFLRKNQEKAPAT